LSTNIESRIMGYFIYDQCISTNVLDEKLIFSNAYKARQPEDYEQLLLIRAFLSRIRMLPMPDGAFPNNRFNKNLTDILREFMTI
jgi:hypothetical protein